MVRSHFCQASIERSIMDNFLIYEEINKRDSCTVYRGRIKRTIDFVMIYCVEKHKRHELSNLVRLMYELDHPHVMKFREWYETTNHLWLVMDLCDGRRAGWRSRALRLHAGLV